MLAAAGGSSSSRLAIRASISAACSLTESPVPWPRARHHAQRIRNAATSPASQLKAEARSLASPSSSSSFQSSPSSRSRWTERRRDQADGRPTKGFAQRPSWRSSESKDTRRSSWRSSEGRDRPPRSRYPTDDRLGSPPTLREQRYQASVRLQVKVKEIQEATPQNAKQALFASLQENFESIPFRLRGSDAILWNQLISAAIAAGRPNEAWRIYNSMKKSGISPNARTYSTFFRGFDHLFDADGQPVSESLVNGLVRDLHSLRQLVAKEKLEAELERHGKRPLREVRQEEDEKDEMDIRNAKDPSSRMKATRIKVIRNERRDYKDLALAYVHAISLLARLKQEDAAWEVYEGLARRTALSARYVLPFPQASIFSVTLNALRYQCVRARAKGAESEWKERLLQVAKAWIEELRRAKTQNLHHRHVESISMDTRMFGQMLRTLSTIGTSDADALALSIAAEFVKSQRGRQPDFHLDSQAIVEDLRRPQFSRTAGDVLASVELCSERKGGSDDARAFADIFARLNIPAQGREIKFG